MDEKRSRIGFHIAITAGIIVLISLLFFLLYARDDRNAENVEPDNSIDNPISIEKNEQITDKETEKGNEKAQNESVKIEGSDGEKSEEDGANPNNKEGGVSIPKPSEVTSDEEFAAFNNTLFIGDSRTEGFRLYSGVNNASYFCLKAMTVDDIVEGKTISMGGQTLSVYDLLQNGNYKKIIIAVGLNELGWNHIETFIDKYGQLIDSIKQKQPDAMIYLQAVLPVSRQKDASDTVHNNTQIYWYNTNIVQLADDKSIMYINPAPAVVDSDGYLLDGATTDGVHLNSEYCKKLASYMADMI